MAEILAHPMLYAALLIVSAATIVEYRNYCSDRKPISKRAESELRDTLARLEK